MSWWRVTLIRIIDAFGVLLFGLKGWVEFQIRTAPEARRVDWWNLR